MAVERLVAPAVLAEEEKRPVILLRNGDSPSPVLLKGSRRGETAGSPQDFPSFPASVKSSLRFALDMPS